jgi:hypothetical protein
MGRSLLIRERELEASGIFMGQVDGLWWSGDCGMSSKNAIRSVLLLGQVCFWLYLLVFRLYTAPYCSSAFPGLYSSCAETGYIINNNFTVKKEKYRARLMDMI